MDVNSVDKGGYKMLHNISPQWMKGDRF
jgi:hypothetical protein